MIQTALLIDGADDPIALRVDDRDRETYIAQGRAGQTPRNFKFSHMIGGIPVYRIDGTLKDTLSDELFMRCAEAEADKFLHPEKYKDMGKQGALSNAERNELERYRAQARKE